MVEGPTERTVTKGMVRQRTFTKEEQSNSNLNNKEESESQEATTSSQECSQPAAERRQRKQWRSQSGLTVSEKFSQSPILDEFFLKEAERSGSSYGNVVPQLRLRLAEQGDASAQLELAREVNKFFGCPKICTSYTKKKEKFWHYVMIKWATSKDNMAKKS